MKSAKHGQAPVDYVSTNDTRGGSKPRGIQSSLLQNGMMISKVDSERQLTKHSGEFDLNANPLNQSHQLDSQAGRKRTGLASAI